MFWCRRRSTRLTGMRRTIGSTAFSPRGMSARSWVSMSIGRLRRDYRGADRGHWFRAGGHPHRRAALHSTVGKRSGRRRKRLRPRRTRRRQWSMHRISCTTCSRYARGCWRGLGDIPRSGLGLSTCLSRLSTPSTASAKRTDRRSISDVCIAGNILRGLEEAAGLPGVRQAVHPGKTTRRHDGLVRRAPAAPTTATGARRRGRV